MSKKRPSTAYLSCISGILSLLFFSLPVVPQILQAFAIFFGWSAYNVTEYYPDQFKNTLIGWAGFFMGIIGLGVWILSTLLTGFHLVSKSF